MTNSHTLGTSCSPRQRQADIEVPNRPVDEDSRGRSACYPQRTFYLLCDRPTLGNDRITKADVSLCWTHRSHSQAHFIPFKSRAPENRSRSAPLLSSDTLSEEPLPGKLPILQWSH